MIHLEACKKKNCNGACMRPIAYISLTFALLFASCAKNEPEVTREKVSRGDPLLDKYASNHGYSKTGGEIRSNSDKKSEFAGKDFRGTNDFSGANYTTEKYASKRWRGDSKYKNKQYSGNTDASRYQHSPDFVQQQARYGEFVSNAQGERFNTSAYETLSSSENSGERLTYKDSDYAKRNNLSNTVILPWKEQQRIQGEKKNLSELSVNDAKVILGRADENGG